MEFSFNDNEKFISHFMLSDMETAKKIANSPEWKNGNMKTVAKMTVNDIEIPFEVVEAFYQRVYDDTIKEAREQFADLEKAAHNMAENILKKQAQTLRDKLWDLEQDLDNIGDVLKPWYEKSNG